KNRHFCRTLRTCPHICKFFGAKMSFPPKLRNRHRALLDECVSFLIPERNSPSAEFVEPFDRIGQMAEERPPSHFSIRDDIHSCLTLERNGFTDGSIFDHFELIMRRAYGIMLLACILQIISPKQAHADITSIVGHPKNRLDFDG